MKKYMLLLLSMALLYGACPAQNLFSETFEVGYSGNFFSASGTSNLGSTYTCTAGNRVGLMTSSGSYITTKTLYVPQGSQVNITFKLNKYSGYSGPVEVYFVVNEAYNFSTLNPTYNGWTKFTSNATTFSCGTNTFNLPSNIVGGQKLSITIYFKNASSTNWVAIDDMSIDASSGSAVPTTYTENFTNNVWYPTSGYVSPPYHSYTSASNGYTYLFSGGVGGSFDYYAAFYTGYDYVEGGSTNFITREINTGGYTHGELRYAFKSLYPCGGPAGYTFDEDYTMYAPSVYIMVGQYTSSASWVQLPVNYYFADNTWRYASYDISAYNNANIKIKFERKAFCSNPCEGVDNLRILDRDCSLSLLACGPITGPSSFSPNTNYNFSVGAVTGATYYKWFVRDGGTLYSGAPSAGLPGIVSGQGTLNAVINFGATPGNYRVLCIPYDTDPTSQPDACYAKISYYNVTVNSCSTPPTVNLQPSSQAVCAGSPVSFTTSASGTGTMTYQWQFNGSNITGAIDSTYQIPSPTGTNAGIYTCIVTDSCGSDTTTQATLTVNSTQAVSVSISANPGTTICAGQSVTFTATPANGGSSPSYQWQLNGSDISGATNSAYTSSTLANGNIITCVMTSNIACPSGNPATSNTLTITITTGLPASVSIAASPGTTICTGTNVTFTATPANGGSTPSYQWQLNGGNVGANSNTYSNSSLSNGDLVTCIMTSSASCVTGSPATSNTLTMTVSSAVTASVIVTASPGTTICAGTNVTFTATPTNGGSTPSYQWQLNGGNVGANSSTYSNSSLSNGDLVTCIMTSNAGCVTGSPATSNTLTMTVTTAVAASVLITASPGTTICAGTNVTFTATPTNGGSTPSYQWQLNGGNVGTNSSTYSNSSLSNGDLVTCIMTSSASCVTGSPATSNTLTMTVSTAVTASVLVTASPGTTICSGTSVVYTATATNGGASPSYQWQLNGGNVGTNSSTYSSSSLNNGDQIVCIMTSNAACVSGSPATSNILTMTVSSSLPASVTISANPATLICNGTSVTFSASPANGGLAPSYQWQINGSNVGTDSISYTTSSLADGDIVTCIMTSSESCASGSPATSNSLTVTISSALPVGVSIAASPGTILCAGDNIIFTATPTNGGSLPVYQWQVNGSNVGANSSVFSGSNFSDGDVITCQLTSSFSCATGNPAVSNSVTLTVSQPLPVSVSIVANPSVAVCQGTQITFTATPTNGGSLPVYQWQVNGSNAGTNASTFSTSSLSDGDIVTCIVTSNASCISGNPATSNAVTVNILPVPSASAGTDQTICVGGNASLTATGGGTYNWNTGATTSSITVSPVATSTYTVTVTSNGCSASDEVTVNVVPVVVADIGPDTTICEGQSLNITANGGTAYNWNTGSTNASISISPAATTTYSVTVSNGYCSDSDEIVVTVNPAPAVDIGSDQVICEGDAATIMAAGSGGSYLWSTGDTTQSITVNPVSSSLYTITVSSGACTATDNIMVSVNPSPDAIFTANDTTVGTGDNVIFSDQSSGADSWLWHFGDGTTSTEQNPVHVYTDDGIYTVILVVTNAEGCSDSIVMTDYIHVFGESEIFIPSCFTPNNDGENDVLYVRGTNIDNLDFRIYDQWGVMIFTSDAVTEGWDGTYNGIPQPVGNYVYRVKITSLQGEPMSLEGIVSLVR